MEEKKFKDRAIIFWKKETSQIKHKESMLAHKETPSKYWWESRADENFHERSFSGLVLSLTALWKFKAILFQNTEFVIEQE